MWAEDITVTNDGFRFVYEVWFFDNLVFKHIGSSIDSVADVERDGRVMFAGGLKRWFKALSDGHL